MKYSEVLEQSRKFGSTLIGKLNHKAGMGIFKGMAFILSIILWNSQWECHFFDSPEGK